MFSIGYRVDYSLKNYLLFHCSTKAKSFVVLTKHPFSWLLSPSALNICQVNLGLDSNIKKENSESVCSLSKLLWKSWYQRSFLFHFPLVSRRAHDPCVALLLKLESILIALSRKTCLRSCFYLLTRKHFVCIRHMLGDKGEKPLTWTYQACVACFQRTVSNSDWLELKHLGQNCGR